jgi:hypothetical protein
VSLRKAVCRTVCVYVCVCVCVLRVSTTCVCVTGLRGAARGVCAAAGSWPPLWLPQSVHRLRRCKGWLWRCVMCRSVTRLPPWDTAGLAGAVGRAARTGGGDDAQKLSCRDFLCRLLHFSTACLCVAHHMHNMY